MAACPFCAILREEAPADVVLDTPEALGFLDVRPLFPGHVLVVPREHVVVLTDLPGERVGPFFEHVQAAARGVEVACGAQGTFVAINNRVSQSVAHLHVHVVPRTKGDGLRGFFWPRTAYDDAAHAARVAAEIRAAITPPG